MIAIGAWLGGLWRVARSAWMVALAYVVVLALTVPLGLMLHRDLPPPAQPPVVEPGAGPVPNLDWLDEVSAGRGGLAGTLTPTIVGVAAPLENLDQLLDGSRPPMFAIALSAASLLAWAWLWGGFISRLGGAAPPFVGACRQSFVAILKLSLVNLVVALALYLTLHPLLFDCVWPALTSGVSEPTAFVWRLVVAIAFIAVLAVTTLIADYARISLALGETRSLRQASTNAVQLIRGNPLAVLLLVLVAAALLAGLLLTYGAFEFIPGGSVPTLGRVVLLGQAFIVTRIVLRLVNAAAQVLLYQRIRLREATR